MRLTKLYIRFFKSFNFDYERKSNPDATTCDWENIDGAWFPYVPIDLEPSITTIVGANESGKSHLLTAVEKLIQGTDIGPSDFCRYSQFFSVQRGQRRAPDFAGDFTLSTSSDVERIRDLLGLDLQEGAMFRLLRESGAPPRIVLLGKDAPQPSEPEIDTDSLQQLLPRVFRIDANVPLPVSIPLHYLVDTVDPPHGSRSSRRRLVQAVLGRTWTDQNELAHVLPDLYAIVSDDSSPQDDRHLERQYELGKSLLFNVANIDATTFTDLAEAIASGNEGYVNGLLQRINDSLASRLNFPRWWAQDREFRLMASTREHDLVFTIRDRTGTHYSFAERSSGLRYFLSYHVQLLAHQPPEDGRSEVLLMDEPDAFLSNQGQQDLLRVLEMFSCPEDGSRQDQLVYVTHSPFLINRNAAERVRVLDKGVAEEGTRVVSDVARNHYEPLRSALGVFVAETSFIGGSNLFVEGLSDQVLLAGVNSHLLRSGAPPMREARRTEQERRWSNRVSRTIDAFLKDYPTTTKRERGKILTEEIEASLDNSLEGDHVRMRILELRRDFKLDRDLTEPIERYEEFRDRVVSLRYGERFAKQYLHGDRTDARAQRADTDGPESPENPGPDGVA